MGFFDPLLHNPTAFIIAIGLFSLLIGSFLNVVIARLPVMMQRQWRSECEQYLDPEKELPDSEIFNLSRPRSHCPSCKKPITAIENIPLLSYLFLKGSCRHCGNHISWQYPLVELLTALLSMAIAAHFGASWLTLTGLLFTWSLIALSVIDLQQTLLPDSITQPMLWLGLLLSLSSIAPIDTATALVGAIAGYLALWSVYWVFKLLTGKEGMGYGDFKLLAMLGAWLGWQALPGIIMLSSILGASVGILLILLKKQDRNVPIPFGPYLAFAGWISLIWGEQINHYYLNFG